MKKSNKKEEAESLAFIRDLMPDRSEEDIEEAKENFRNYLLLVKRMCERLESEESEAAQKMDDTKHPQGNRPCVRVRSPPYYLIV